MNGIIASLTQRCGGNVHDCGCVIVTSSTSPLRLYPPKLAADLPATTFFYSENEPNQWLCYDFQRMRVTPTHYSIRSVQTARPGDANLKSWVVEGSADGGEWTQLDRQTKRFALNDAAALATFPVGHSEQVRFVRLRQTGENHAGGHSLLISAFEIYGYLVE
jgi:hypothetical protein